MNSHLKGKFMAKTAGKATPHASAMKRDMPGPRHNSIPKRPSVKPMSKTFGLSRNSVKPPAKKTSVVQASKLSASQGRLKNANSAMGTQATAISLKMPGGGLTTSQLSATAGQNTTQTLKGSLLAEDTEDFYKGRSKFKNSIISAGGQVGSGRNTSNYQRASADRKYNVLA